jgi:hypothetical protein
MIKQTNRDRSLRKPNKNASDVAAKFRRRKNNYRENEVFICYLTASANGATPVKPVIY